MGGQLFPLANRVLDGNLAEMLKTWRAEGLSCETIARRLDADHDIDVSGETVRSWVKRGENRASDPDWVEPYREALRP